METHDPTLERINKTENDTDGAEATRLALDESRAFLFRLENLDLTTDQSHIPTLVFERGEDNEPSLLEVLESYAKEFGGVDLANTYSFWDSPQEFSVSSASVRGGAYSAGSQATSPYKVPKKIDIKEHPYASLGSDHRLVVPKTTNRGLIQFENGHPHFLNLLGQEVRFVRHTTSPNDTGTLDTVDSGHDALPCFKTEVAELLELVDRGLREKRNSDKYRSLAQYAIY